MKIIVPRTFVPADITSSPALSETIWAAYTAAIGDRRYITPSYDLYEAVAVTTDDPVAGAAKDVPTWVKVGKVNRFAMFDGLIDHATQSATGILVSFAATGFVANGLALFGVSGDSVTVTVTDPIDGEVYNRTIDLVDNSGVASWSDYFFSPITFVRDVVLTDLPLYGSAIIEVAIAGVASCGEMIIGAVTDIGITNYGTAIGILDFSRKDRDIFGNAILIQRTFASRVSYQAKVFTAQIAAVVRTLAERRAVPTVFIGSELHPETIVYGFFRDFGIVLSGPNVSDCTIEVEGLI